MQLLTADTSVPLTQSRIIMFKIPRTNVDITLRQGSSQTGILIKSLRLRREKTLITSSLRRGQSNLS